MARPSELPHADDVVPPPKKRGRPNVRRRSSTGLARLDRLPIAPVDPGKADAQWLELEKLGHEAMRHRAQELGQRLGHISSGTCQMLRAASMATTDAEWLRARWAETGKLEFLELSHKLTSMARQHQLAAWELAVREAKLHSETSKRDQRADLVDALEAGMDK